MPVPRAPSLPVQRPRREPPLPGAAISLAEARRSLAPPADLPDRRRAPRRHPGRPGPLSSPRSPRRARRHVESATSRARAHALRSDGLDPRPARRLYAWRRGGPRGLGARGGDGPAFGSLVERYMPSRGPRPGARGKPSKAGPQLFERYSGDDPRVRGPRQDPAPAAHRRESLSGTKVKRWPCRASGLGRAPLAPPRERPGLLPLHRRRLPPQAPGRRIPRACSPARAAPSAPTGASTTCPSGHARQAPLDRLRLGHPLRRGPGRPARHLRQGRQLRRLHLQTVDDAKKLYSGFDLCAPTTSVSMTINGPAPMVLGFFMNAAIDQRASSTSSRTV